MIVSPFFSPNIGGVETHLDDLVAVLSERGHCAEVITYQPLTSNLKGLAFEQRGIVSIKRVQWFGVGLFPRLEKFGPLSLVYLVPGLLVHSILALTRQKSIRTIHAQGLASSIVALVLKSLFQVRVVVSLHTDYRLLRKGGASTVADLLSRADEILVCSSAAMEDLRLLGVPVKKLRPFTYWVNQSIFRPLDRNMCRLGLGLGSEFIALFVGRFVESKGVRLVLEAAKLCPKVTFLFVGEGPLEDN
jgi:glycosyltransferase involved in cell wall biosynthesis